MNMHLFINLSSGSEFIGVVQNIGLAILTIFIPLGIYIFEQGKQYSDLDKKIITEHIISGEILLSSIGLVFIPLLFWDISNYIFKFFIICIWLIGTVSCLFILIKSYKWIISDDKTNIRIKFLKKITKSELINIIWKSVWSSNSNNQIETNYFDIFANKIESNIVNLTIVSELLDDFKNNLDIRDIYFLSANQEVLPKLLKWHFKYWENEYKTLSQPELLEEFSKFSEISNTLNQILISIENRVLGERMSYMYFKYIYKHIEENKHIFIKGEQKNYYYTETFLPLFCRTLFEKASNSPEKYDIWKHYFPTEWKITEKNLINNKEVTSVILHQFLEWMSSRLIGNNTKDWDDALDEVARELFPSTDPSMWAKILTFAIQPYGNNRVQSFIEKPPKFGFIGRIFMFNHDENLNDRISKMNNEYEEQTIKLALYLFNNLFTKELLNDYIKQTKEIHFKNKDKEIMRSALQDIFIKLLESQK